ncbi:histidinol-phosphate aminotransferase [Bacteroidia bacterium]|nr:histidinol-phosphate aminotransferase [Bacteroidia bacterium]
MKTFEHLLRPNIRSLQPYSTARDEFQGEASIFLDANESPYNMYNRYPDPMHHKARNRVSILKDIAPGHIFLGNGSDEAIDLVMRAFCEPAVDNIVTITPSYGMYKVAADINNVECRQVALRSEDFSLDANAVLDAADEHTKVVFLCSPNNPTGNLLQKEEVYRILKYFKGIVVVDEAYIDFAGALSLIRELASYPRLVVLQTFSKAWAMAALRLGMAFASPGIISIMYRIKYPYNLNIFTTEYLLHRLDGNNQVEEQVKELLSQKDVLMKELVKYPFVEKVYPSDTNFLLVKVKDANALYNYLLEKKIVVRNRHTLPLCENCLRITVGAPEENSRLLHALSAY